MEIKSDISEERLARELRDLVSQLDESTLIVERPDLASRLKSALLLSADRLWKPESEGEQITKTEDIGENFAERVAKTFTYSRINSFQEYDFEARRGANAASINFKKLTLQEGGIRPYQVC